MKYLEALKALGNDRPIRRDSWDRGTFVAMLRTVDGLLACGLNGEPATTDLVHRLVDLDPLAVIVSGEPTERRAMVWDATNKDKTADDWAVFAPKASPESEAQR